MRASFPGRFHRIEKRGFMFDSLFSICLLSHESVGIHRRISRKGLTHAAIGRDVFIERIEVMLDILEEALKFLRAHLLFVYFFFYFAAQFLVVLVGLYKFLGLFLVGLVQD